MTDAWWRRGARALLQQTEELLLPRMCVVCERALAGAGGDLACAQCWACVAALPHPRCERCGHPSATESCRWCPLLPPYVRAARSWCWMPGGVAGRLVYALKYEGWHAVGLEMAARMARIDWPEDVRRECRALIPVPLAAARERARGFNQSAVLARALGRAMGVAVWEDVIERPRTTETQTRLTPEQRSYNVANAFRIVPGASARLRDAHVILVDDVVTTAATLNECAATLWGAGARIISYVTFGRARSAGDAPLPRG